MSDRRKQYELKVIATMVKMYCRAKHGGSLCADCDALISYCEQRISHCPLGEAKSTCRLCTIHCYAPEYRQRVREVMRYAGPRMMLHHPLMAIRHLLSERFAK